MLSKLKSIRFQVKPYLSNFVSIPTLSFSIHMWHLQTCVSIQMQHLQSNLPLNLHVAFASNPALNLHVIVTSTFASNLSVKLSILQATHLSRSICDCNNLQSAADHSRACTKHAPQNQSSKGLLNWNPATTSSRLKPGPSAITCDLICCCCSRGWNYPGLNHSQAQPDIRIAKNCMAAWPIPLIPGSPEELCQVSRNAALLLSMSS